MAMVTRFRFSVVCLAMCVVAGCDQDSPISPSPNPTSFVGKWDGTMRVEGVVEGSGMTLTADTSLIISQAGQALTGTWFYQVHGNSTQQHEPFTGTANGDSVELVFPVGVCTATLTGTRSGRSLNLRSDGFNSPEGDDLCRTSTVLMSVTKQ
jgi:hypothetical protein